MKRVILSLFIIFAATFAFSQQQQQGGLIFGKVVGLDGQPLVGAQVTVQGFGVSTITDVKGEFSIHVNTTAPVSLVVKYGKFRPYVIGGVKINSGVVVGLDKKGKKAWHYILNCKCEK